MIVYHNDCTEPYENMATEEYLLDSAGDEDIFMLWRNEPAVIIGQNQNAYAEIDRAYAELHGIKIVRRLTGGGAVFHDLGNINYTFISKDVQGGSLNFERFCKPIIEALKAIGLDASLSGRNDITVDGFKVSGTAQCVRNGHVMHHGTLLWDADFGKMAGVLKPDETKLSSKGIKSVRSRVGNLKDLLTSAKKEGKVPHNAPEISDVLELRNYLEERAGEPTRIFSEAQRCEIKKLADEKYSSWEWIYGKSKDFSVLRKKRFSYGLVELHMTLSGGIISDISVRGDFFGSAPINELEGKLCGCKCTLDAISDALSDISSYIFGATVSDIAKLIAG